MKRVLSTLSLTALLLSGAVVTTGPQKGHAQEPDSLRSDEEGVLIRGSVEDQTTGRALPSVEVRFVDTDDDRLAWQGASDSTGTFTSPRIRAGSYAVEVNALGFQSLRHELSLSGYGAALLEIALVPTAIELEPIIVVSRRQSKLERAGFYTRRERGFGHTFTREEIEARNVIFVTDLARTVPGVTVAPYTLGGGGALRMRGGCVPDVVLDGVRLSGPVRIDDLLTVQNLEGIEFYHGVTAPVQYARSSCGTILAWTREPGAAGGSPWTWKRAGVAGGLLLLGVLLIG